ncbi:hypothetical protein HY768_10925 [candidate division TA06 bacterium]|uniref:HTH HARE-type domain-containing protein n=1 Tax=candidate division TA06 bacterium TaxID=2250710 RepID=A0A933IC38_UNCT6|nr:hypothetical protein [candidate division TA06 bacterium]
MQKQGKTALDRLSLSEIESYLKAKKRQNQAEKANLKRKRQRLQNELKEVEERLSSFGAICQEQKPAPRPKPVSKGKRMPGQPTLAELILGILKRRGPLGISDIKKSVLNRGYRSASKDLSQGIRNKLGGIKGIKRVSPGVYGIAK